MSSYRIITDVTADIPSSMAPEVTFLPMPVTIAEKTYLYGSSDTITAEEFYALQRSGEFASTAQITPTMYMDEFTPYLEQGEDVLYLCFSSGLSGCWGSVQVAAQTLQQAHPSRRIICLDTLCASIGEGFLVMEAVKKQREGFSLDELAAWVERARLSVCHWFTVDGFTHLRHGGRVSPATAAIGSVLSIKPLLHVDEEGKLLVAEKPRGVKAAMNAQLKRMKTGWSPDLGKQVLIGHGDCLKRAEELGAKVAEAFPEAEIAYSVIGPVIGCHTGPGMLALVYWGENR